MTYQVGGRVESSSMYDRLPPIRYCDDLDIMANLLIQHLLMLVQLRIEYGYANERIFSLLIKENLNKIEMRCDQIRWDRAETKTPFFASQFVKKFLNLYPQPTLNL